MRRFEQRTVVITGASRGIGKGIAKRFADEGANLVLAANEASVEAVAEEFRSAGANAVSSVCDVTNKAEVEALSYTRLAPVITTVRCSNRLVFCSLVSKTLAEGSVKEENCPLGRKCVAFAMEGGPSWTG